jgi:hypothetical protein
MSFLSPVLMLGDLIASIPRLSLVNLLISNSNSQSGTIALVP